MYNLSDRLLILITGTVPAGWLASSVVEIPLNLVFNSAVVLAVSTGVYKFGKWQSSIDGRLTRIEKVLEHKNET